MNYKKDFPIFKNNPDLIFFDSTASSQKPNMVIDGIKEYLENDYSNIHRGMYDIAINSDNIYKKSKKIVADNIGAKSYKEIIYTYNSTYALNFLSQSLKLSGFLKKGDKVLVSITEHHANIVAWLILKEEIGIEVDFVGVNDNFEIDINDFENKYTDNVKIISFTHVSNVTGQIFNLEEIGKLKREDTIFIVDGSQSVPHFKVDVSKLNCDFMFFTGHKIMADSGIGVLWGKETILKNLKPIFSGGGAISEVHCELFTNAGLPDKFEPGTPNITGAVSLMKAFEYIDHIGGYNKLEEVENQLVKYFLEKINKYKNIKIIGSNNKEDRVGVFSLVVAGYHSNDLADYFADNNIAVRAGKHCAHPLFEKLGIGNSLRISLYLYNTKEEIDFFFNKLDELIKK